MSIVSPFHDICVAGCLANASLAGAAKKEAPAPFSEAPFAPSSTDAQTLAQAAPRRRRAFDALLNLVSGPTMPADANRP